MQLEAAVLEPESPNAPRATRILRSYMDDIVSRCYGRQATDEEIDTALREDPSDDLTPPHGLFLVARADGKVLGCAGLRLLPERIGEITRLFVVPAARGRGLASRLINELETLAREHDLTTLRLDTRDDLREARRLYARLGYQEVAPFNEGPYADHWFEKVLCDAGTVGREPVSTNAATLSSYQVAAALYVQAEPATVPDELAAFLDRFAGLVAVGGSVLEIGSATGRDAAVLETRGLNVRRTDATPAFVDRLRAQGVAAEVLNVITDELGGPWDAIYAGAVFLHVNVLELADVLARAAAAVTPAGLLAFTVKEGDGSRWTTVKLDQPRHFTYWREEPLRSLIGLSRWEVVNIEHVVGHSDSWLHCLCRKVGGVL